MLTVGDSFNSNGFSFAFLDRDSQSELWSEAIQWSKDIGLFDKVVTDNVPTLTFVYNSCAAQFSTDPSQLDFVNVEGLFIISMLAVLIGVVIGLWEVASASNYSFHKCNDLMVVLCRP